MAKEIQLKLKEDDIAPEFSAATNGGGKISLADFRGKTRVKPEEHAQEVLAAL